RPPCPTVFPYTTLFRSDEEVAVTILYSTDPMRRAGTSKAILSDYTFRVNDSPEYSQDFARFRGRIVDGVILTEPLDTIYMHEGPDRKSTRLNSSHVKIS